jgi:regulator of sigma E protease
VKIFGETPDEESTNGPDAVRSFINKAKWKQAVVLFAGVFMNFVLAWVLFSFGFMSGLPTSVGAEPAGYQLQNVNLVITSVAPNSPAEKSGLKIGDKILTISVPASSDSKDTLNNPNPESLKNFIVSHGNKVNESNPLGISYVRGKNEANTAFLVPEMKQSVPTIGISMDQIGTAKLPILKAFWGGALLTVSVTKSTVLGLFGLISEALRGQGSFETVTGPVGMVGIVGDAYQFGFVYLLSFAALISINLAIINLFPFPALDGGRLFFLLIEKIKGSRINPQVANTLNMVGFVILITLMLFITYHDVVKLF